MNRPAIRVEDIAPISHREGMALAETEYQRFADVLAQLQPGDWTVQTVCTAWNVKQLIAHVVGFAESNASFRVLVSGIRHGKRRAAEKGYDQVVHGMNEVQVEEREHLAAAELVRRWSQTWPKALAGRKRFPPFLRHVPFDFGPPIGKKPMGSYLMDVMYTRDTWMHRIDLCRAVRLDPALTAEHDGRLIADMVAEWARVHDLAFTLHLDGPAGGTFVSGAGGDELTIDAVEWIWIISGRGTGTGLLSKELPL
ncbi:maleylpyruvate isomerase family mycothiol-dependent enzyme [Gordonia sp. (in: high G+C Gram-positive bacteria)]|uniref:maleylpyruvate isomerase family mycothiol-dependent enzyme n=1 Tax=Gordonia sp. (in: high G+C Gram-positive bacteria) TaxID=84139 RepID=UPI003C71B328